MPRFSINEFTSLNSGISPDMWPGDQIEDFVDAMGLFVNYKDIITLVTANIVRFADNDLYLSPVINFHSYQIYETTNPLE